MGGGSSRLGYVYIFYFKCGCIYCQLCEPHQHSGLEGRKLRNAYSKALLNMLRKGVMEGPLLHRPPDGKLDPFPGYLVCLCQSHECVTWEDWEYLCFDSDTM
mgnify:CR=1 FL=1